MVQNTEDGGRSRVPGSVMARCGEASHLAGHLAGSLTSIQGSHLFPREETRLQRMVMARKMRNC